MVLHNPTATPQTAHLELLPRGSATAVASGTVQLAVGETKRIENLYDFLHAADGAGMLRLTGEVIAWVRTFNQGAQGTFGQDLTPISPEGGYAPGTPVFFYRRGLAQRLPLKPFVGEPGKHSCEIYRELRYGGQGNHRARGRLHAN
jgi:hypothetical protein